MGKYIEGLKIRDKEFVVYEVEVRNRWWRQGKNLLPIDGGKSWQGEEQSVVKKRVNMPSRGLSSHEIEEAAKFAAAFIDRARNRAKLLLSQDILTLDFLSSETAFDVAVHMRGTGSFGAFLPEEWEQLLAWNSLPDPEEAAKQIIEWVEEGTFEQEKVVELLNSSIKKLDTYDELHEQLAHVYRYQPGFTPRNHRVKKPYRSKRGDEDYREPDWDDDK